MKKIKTKLELIKAADKYHRPHKSQFKRWFSQTMDYVTQLDSHSHKINGREELSLCVRLVEKEEMLHLAAQFRHKSDSNTVLSFPCEDSIPLQLPLLGDIVMCGEMIVNEARNHHLDFKEYWAFLFIHSLLHLLGFNHGEEMEEIENAIMLRNNFSLLHRESK